MEELDFDYNRGGGNETQNLLRKLLNTLHLPLKSKILEINCGEGENIKYLSELGYEAFGLDENFEKIRLGKSKNPQSELYQHDFQNIFYVGYFDMAFCLSGDTFWKDSNSKNRTLLKNLLSSLESQGHLFFKFSNLPDESLTTLLSGYGKIINLISTQNQNDFHNKIQRPFLIIFSKR